MFLLILFLLLNTSLFANTGKGTEPPPKLEIKILASRIDPIKIGQKEKLAIFECEFQNGSGETAKDIYKRIYIKEGTKLSEIFYVSPVLNKSLEPGKSVTGVIAFKAVNTIQPYSVFVKTGENETKEFPLSDADIIGNFSEPYSNLEQTAIRVKVKFETGDFSEVVKYDSIKTQLESDDPYVKELYIKYELMADYKNYKEKIYEEEYNEFNLLSYRLGNRESFFLKKKFIPAAKKRGFEFYDKDEYDSSYYYLAGIISADTSYILTNNEFNDAIYAYAFSATRVWAKDTGAVNINTALNYLDKLSKNTAYQNKCKAILQMGNIYYLIFNNSGRKDAESKNKAIDYYTNVLKESACSDSQKTKATDNINLLIKGE
ncbi:MAG TPA: hypothetical protein VIL99_00695 [Ignavibacteria bacterium]